MNHPKQTTRGITLIELIIVVGVISILAAFAYPSYVERTQRVKRTDAKAALLNIAGQQERFFFTNNRFTDSFTELGVEETTEKGFYSLTLTTDGTSTFTARAEPLDGQQEDTRCATFTIDQLGRKQATGTGTDDPSALCWR